MSGRFIFLSFLTALLALGLAGSASATIVSAANATDISNFPLGMDVRDNLVGGSYGSAANSGLGSPFGARYFTESTIDISNVFFDVINPTDGVIYGPGQNSNAGVLPNVFGTSHYIFWDPLPTGGQHFSSFTFDAPILGILWNTTRLGATDATLGLPGVTYGGAFGARGFEDHGTQFDNVVVSGTTLRFSSQAGSPGDWFRVVTQPVPEPSSVVLVVLGLGALAVRRRRRS